MSQAPDVRLDGLYGDRILDHYRSPRNRQPLPDADLSAGEFNPFCGDRVDLSLTLGPGTRIVQTSAASEGCSIIQASASMLSCLLEGKTLEEAESLAADFRTMMAGKQLPPAIMARLGEVEALQVVRTYPVRIKCALLPWVALEQGLKAHKNRES